MLGFLEVLRRNAFGLFRFTGRERRATFWPYAGTVLGAGFAAIAVATAREITQSFGKMQAFAREHPDQATVTTGPGSYSITIHGNHPELFPDVTNSIYVIGAICAVLVVLLGAAVARRLHDRGRTGLWGLAPLPFLATAFALMPKLFAAREPDASMFFMLFCNNLLYLGALALLLVMLLGDGEKGANRFGLPVPD